MKFLKSVLFVTLIFYAGFVNAGEDKTMSRSERADKIYEQLFLSK